MRILDWWLGGESSPRGLVRELALRVGSVLAFLVFASYLGGNGVGILLTVLVVGAWIFVWRKVRDRT